MDDAWFRQRYDADTANAARQTWKDYQDWIRTFYEGKRFPPVPGWRSREEEILRRIPDEARARLGALLQETGRLLASEWAKDNAVRRVATGDLQAWGKRFGDAARTPKDLEAALLEVRAELARRGVSA